jgi:Family of unknown function (DUF695)
MTLSTKFKEGVFQKYIPLNRVAAIILDTVPYQFIGRITDNGRRELFFYMESPTEIHEKLRDFIDQGNPIREFEYSILEDENWDRVSFFFDY